MSTRAKVAAALAFVIVAGWSWHHGRFDGQTVVVIVVLMLTAAGVAAVSSIDTSRVDRLADPRPLPGERRPGC